LINIPSQTNPLCAPCADGVKQLLAQDGDDASNSSVKRSSTERQGKVNLCFLLQRGEKNVQLGEILQQELSELEMNNRAGTYAHKEPQGGHLTNSKE
jgi:hypothetical protein